MADIYINQASDSGDRYDTHHAVYHIAADVRT